jgi:hypothetical protein
MAACGSKHPGHLIHRYDAKEVASSGHCRRLAAVVAMYNAPESDSSSQVKSLSQRRGSFPAGMMGKRMLGQPVLIAVSGARRTMIRDHHHSPDHRIFSAPQLPCIASKHPEWFPGSRLDTMHSSSSPGDGGSLALISPPPPANPVRRSSSLQPPGRLPVWNQPLWVRSLHFGL